MGKSLLTTVLFFSLIILKCNSQQLTQLSGLPPVSFRGVDLLNDQEWWLSGQLNTVVKTSDGGNTWKVFHVGDTSKHTDFRDIEVLPNGNVLVLGITNPACIFKSSDGGDSWRKVFEDSTLFLDGFDFWDNKNGICLGDPVNGYWTILETSDGGESWNLLKKKSLPEAQDQEAAFAAGGGPIKTFGKKEVAFVTGGSEFSRLIFSKNSGKNWEYRFPLIASNNSAGVFTLEKNNNNELILLGGDYQLPYDSSSNIALIQQEKYNNITVLADNVPRGYRCAVSNVSGSIMVAVGDEGLDLSPDGGHTWRPIESPGFYSVKCSSNTCVMAGKKGRVAVMRFN